MRVFIVIAFLSDWKKHHFQENQFQIKNIYHINMIRENNFAYIIIDNLKALYLQSNFFRFESFQEF